MKLLTAFFIFSSVVWGAKCRMFGKIGSGIGGSKLAQLLRIAKSGSQRMQRSDWDVVKKTISLPSLNSYKSISLKAGGVYLSASFEREKEELVFTIYTLKSENVGFGDTTQSLSVKSGMMLATIIQGLVERMGHPEEPAKSLRIQTGTVINSNLRQLLSEFGFERSKKIAVGKTVVTNDGYVLRIMR